MAGSAQTRPRGRRPGFLDLLVPRRCVQCSRRGWWICPECHAGVLVIRPPLCLSCGREIGAGNRCQDCARERPLIDGIRAATRYEGAMREAIHKLKYSGHRAIVESLSPYLAVLAQEQIPAVDLLVPVPLHANRLRQRGYNQAELLARALAKEIETPVLQALERVRETADQVKLKRDERIANLKGAIACSSPESVRGRTILIVDDVCTTGSTLLACAAPLRRAGAAAVWAAALARQDNGRT